MDESKGVSSDSADDNSTGMKFAKLNRTKSILKDKSRRNPRKKLNKAVSLDPDLPVYSSNMLQVTSRASAKVQPSSTFHEKQSSSLHDAESNIRVTDSRSPSPY